MAFPSVSNKPTQTHEAISEYVAELQLHMTLQARNLVPTLNASIEDSRRQLLHETQADLEKLISRQAIGY